MTRRAQRRPGGLIYRAGSIWNSIIRTSAAGAAVRHPGALCAPPREGRPDKLGRVAGWLVDTARARRQEPPGKFDFFGR